MPALLGLPPDDEGIEVNEEEALLAAQLYRAIQDYANDSERTQQSKGFVLGVSDLGTCQERTRRALAEITEPDRDVLESFLGTAVGKDVEAAIARAFPEVYTQSTVTVHLEGDGGLYTLTGHPDVIFPWGIMDGKTTDGLEIPKRNGSNRQQKFQRHLYALGAANGGYFSVPLEEAKVGNMWIDRSGRTKELFVELEPFDPQVVDEATMWLDEAVYAFRNGQVGQKEPPREWCARACGHFEDCRLYDTDVTGISYDPELMTAVELHREGKAMEKEGKRMADEANAALRGFTGYVPGFQVRWTHINPSDVAYTRDGYDRLNIQPLKN